MLTVKNLVKHYHTGSSKRLVYTGLNIDFPTGTFTTIFGPNGCGKSTLARIIAGLEPYDSGELVGISQIKNSIGFVFQDYRRTLLPWATVYENVVFPLTLRKMRRPEMDRAFNDITVLTGIKLDPNQRVISLSGGQAQLVAILRALIINPKLLILDEPFAAIDYQNTRSLREKISEITDRLKLTVIFISHDLDEAITLGDRVVFLTSPPAAVDRVIEVPLPKPRKLELEASEEFYRIKSDVLKYWNMELAANQA